MILSVMHSSPIPCYFIPRRNISNPAPYRPFTLRAPNALSLFHCLRRTKVSVQVSDPVKFSITT